MILPNATSKSPPPRGPQRVVLLRCQKNHPHKSPLGAAGRVQCRNNVTCREAFGVKIIPKGFAETLGIIYSQFAWLLALKMGTKQMGGKLFLLMPSRGMALIANDPCQSVSRSECY